MYRADQLTCFYLIATLISNWLIVSINVWFPKHIQRVRKHRVFEKRNGFSNFCYVAVTRLPPILSYSFKAPKEMTNILHLILIKLLIRRTTLVNQEVEILIKINYFTKYFLIDSWNKVRKI